MNANALSICDYLSEKSIHFFPTGISKDDIFFKLISVLPVDHRSALQAVLEREKAGGTVVDSAIAIPHARLKGLKTIELAVGVQNEAPQDQPRLFFLFLSPKENTKIHLLFLSSLSSLLQTDGFTENLLQSKATHEVVRIIRQIEKGL